MLKKAIILSTTVLMFSNIAFATDTMVQVNNTDSNPVPVKIKSAQETINVKLDSSSALTVTSGDGTNFKEFNNIVINRAAISHVQKLREKNKYLVRIFYMSGNSQLVNGRVPKDEQREASYTELEDNSDYDIYGTIKTWLGIPDETQQQEAQ